MNSNPNLQFNIIKGLQILIGDIRNCTTKEEETKRVEEELDKIRKKFSANKVLTGYDKKKYVWKLIYIHILGYDVDFGHNYSADLITSVKFSEKITGYISMSILFKDDNSEIEVMINSIRNDLLNQNAVCQSMALTLAANLQNNELLTAIHKDVIKYITNHNEKTSNTLKKALIVLSKIIKQKPDTLNAEKWSAALSKIVEMKNFESLLALCSLFHTILTTVGPIGYESLADKIMNTILMKFKDCPEQYIYYHIKCPWLQIKILQIMCL
jgi:AP-2 complex subunit alpha